MDFTVVWHVSTKKPGQACRQCRQVCCLFWFLTISISKSEAQSRMLVLCNRTCPWPLKVFSVQNQSSNFFKTYKKIERLSETTNTWVSLLLSSCYRSKSNYSWKELHPKQNWLKLSQSSPWSFKWYVVPIWSAI